jgi:hypothetical protein
MRLIAGFVAGLAAVFACVSIAVTAQRIEEASYLQIGGIEQWVTIRGDDARKTCLASAPWRHGVEFSPLDVVSRRILYFDGLQFADAKLREQPVRGASRPDK